MFRIKSFISKEEVASSTSSIPSATDIQIQKDETKHKSKSRIALEKFLYFLIFLVLFIISIIARVFIFV